MFLFISYSPLLWSQPFYFQGILSHAKPKGGLNKIILCQVMEFGLKLIFLRKFIWSKNDHYHSVLLTPFLRCWKPNPIFFSLTRGIKMQHILLVLIEYYVLNVRRNRYFLMLINNIVRICEGAREWKTNEGNGVKTEQVCLQNKLYENTFVTWTK